MSDPSSGRRLEYSHRPSFRGCLDSGLQSEKDEATTFFTTAQAVEKFQATGAIPDIAFEKGVQNLLEERGWIPGLGDALAELDEEERFPSLAEPDDTDPSALQAGDPGNSGKEVDPTSAGAGGGGSAARRRAANDALRNVGLSDAAVDDVMAMIDAVAEPDD